MSQPPQATIAALQTQLAELRDERFLGVDDGTAEAAWYDRTDLARTEVHEHLAPPEDDG